MILRIIVALGMTVVGRPAFAQSAPDLVGTYTFSHEMGIEGNLSNVGAKGILILDAGGRYALTIIAPNVPNVAANNRRTATGDEAKAIVAGTIAHFGAYLVDNGTLIFKIERASFPNWNGMEQKR